MMNQVNLIGRVGRDPEVKSFNNGGKIVNVTIATSERWKTRDGEAKEETQWHRVTITGEKMAEIVERYVTKGDMLCVTGKLVYREWTDKDGQKRSSPEIVLDAFGGQLRLMPKGGDRREDAPPRERPVRQTLADDLADDLPF